MKKYVYTFLDGSADGSSKMKNLKYNTLVSIGGGINLRPKSFRPIKKSKTSRKIKNIRKIKNQMKLVGKVSKNNNWKRNKIGYKKPNINPLPPIDNNNLFNYSNFNKTISDDKKKIIYYY